MAQATNNKRAEFDRQKMINDLKVNLDKFLSTGSEWDLRALSTLVNNKVNGDRETKAGTLIVTAKTSNVRDVARSINYIDAVLAEGKTNFGNPRNGDMQAYATNLIKLIDDINNTASIIDACAKEAIKNNIGPAWAIRNFVQESLVDTYKVSKRQSEKLTEEFSRERRKNPETTLDLFMKPKVEEAEKAEMSLKEFLIQQAEQIAANGRDVQKAIVKPKIEAGGIATTAIDSGNKTDATGNADTKANSSKADKKEAKEAEKPVATT